MEASLMLIFGEKTNREPKNTTTPDTNSNNKKEILMSA
jgi:hypothetical protein